MVKLTGTVAERRDLDRGDDDDVVVPLLLSGVAAPLRCCFAAAGLDPGEGVLDCVRPDLAWAMATVSGHACLLKPPVPSLGV